MAPYFNMSKKSNRRTIKNIATDEEKAYKAQKNHNPVKDKQGR